MRTVLRAKRKDKHPLVPPATIHDFESVGDIMRRLRREAEGEMTDRFSHPLSLRLDSLLFIEQRIEEDLS